MYRMVLFFTAVWIMSCNNPAGKSVTKNADTTTVADTNEIVKMPPPQIKDTIFTGFGNEPFWAVYVIGNKSIVFHPADGPEKEVPYVAPAITSTETRYTSSNDSTALELTITKKNCSDGMSDKTHAFQVKLKVNAITYTGCGQEGAR